jgi:RNA polymerase sigma factor (sigma-70 family)
MGKAEVNAGTAASSGSEPPDNVLLERFTARRDEAAFTALVRRYGPLVLGICRRVLQHEQDAEDAFQAVFCVLARKAGTLRPGTAVGAWLYTVTYRIARKAKANQVRRHMRETDLPDLPAPDHSPEWLWRELRPVLDEEVSRLPERFRRPFVLCCLEGKTNEQAAAQLNCPLGTVLSRLARARERLRARLTRRGLTLSAEMLAVVLGYQATAAPVGVALAEAAVQAGVRYAAGQPVPVGVAALADGFLKALARARLIRAVGLASALGIMVLIVCLFSLLPRDTGKRNRPAPPWPPTLSPQAERQKLQGGWQVVSVERDGQALPDQGMRLVFADGQVTVFVPGFQAAPMTYVLDPSQKPRAIDITSPVAGVWPGIYHLEGESLRLCLDQNDTTRTRPTAFHTEPDGQNRFLYVLQRAVAGPGASAEPAPGMSSRHSSPATTAASR